MLETLLEIPRPRVSAIALVAASPGFDSHGPLPWTMEGYRDYFYAQTLFKPVIYGVTSALNVERPLANRYNIVVSERKDVVPLFPNHASSLTQAIEMGALYTERSLPGYAFDGRKDEVMIAGGNRTFRSSEGLIDRLYLTLMGSAKVKDFNDIPTKWSDWQLVHRIKGSFVRGVQFEHLVLDKIDQRSTMRLAA